MATYPLTAMVLRKTKLGETDLILTLLGEDGALHKAVAKGARKPGSKFGGRAEPGTIFTALIAQGKSLDIITDAKTVAANRSLREDYDATLTLSVILDFAATVSQEALADQRFYALTVATLEALDRTLASDEDTFSSMRLKVILIAYLLKGAAMQGYRPDFDDFFTEERSHDEHAACSEDIQRQFTYLAYLLGVTYQELDTVDIKTFPSLDGLLHLTRVFLQENIPARLKALDFYTGK